MNHFIEYGEDPEGKGYITVHTGSRNLGTRICDYWVSSGSKSIVKEAIKEANKKIKAEEPYNLEEHFKLSEYNFVYSYHGQEIVFFEDSTLPRPVKNALLAAIYLDPAMILHFDSGFTITPYIMYRDGLIAINTAGNILWITLSSFCGIIVFRRKEIRC